MSIVIHTDNLEREYSQLDHGSDGHVSLCIELPLSHDILESAPLHEWTPLNAWITACHLIHLDCIITTEELDYVPLIILLLVLRHNAAFKPKDKLVVCEHLVEILLRSFHIKVEDILKSILLWPKPIIGGDWVVYSRLILLMEGHRNLGMVHPSQVPCLSEIITFIQQALPVVNIDVLAQD